MKISNIDKHKVLANIQDMNIVKFIMVDAKGFFEPKHLGDTVLTGVSNGKPVFVETPCYVPQTRMYALRDGKWLMFMIPMDDHLIEFMPFMTKATNNVIDILNKFYSFWS